MPSFLSFFSPPFYLSSHFLSIFLFTSFLSFFSPPFYLSFHLRPTLSTSLPPSFSRDVFVFYSISLCLSLSLSHTHTHTLLYLSPSPISLSPFLTHLLSFPPRSLYLLFSHIFSVSHSPLSFY